MHNSLLHHQVHPPTHNLGPPGFSSFRGQSSDQRNGLIKKCHLVVGEGVEIVGLKRGYSRTEVGVEACQNFKEWIAFLTLVLLVGLEDYLFLEYLRIPGRD